MDEYNKDWDDGHKTEVRFCKCGRALIVGSREGKEWAMFQATWKSQHIGIGHQQITFREWLNICLTPRIAVAA